MRFFRIYEVSHKNLPIEVVFAINQKTALYFSNTKKFCKQNGWAMKGIKIDRYSSYAGLTEGEWSSKVSDGGLAPKEMTLVEERAYVS